MRAPILPLLVAATAALAVPASHARAGTFDALASEAERIDSLESFLVRYVGRCTDPYLRRTCEANVGAAREAARARTFVVRVPDAAPLVKPELRGAGYLLLVTPFVDGGGLGLTHGTPTSRGGEPRVGLVPVTGALPPGKLEMEFEAPFRTGAVELEIVFRPESAWRLPRKDGGSYEGVAARFLALRVVDARTGEPIAETALGSGARR